MVMDKYGTTGPKTRETSMAGKWTSQSLLILL